MTRGIVQILQGEDVITLYMGSDSYPTGLGLDLLNFVKKEPVASLGVNDYAMKLLRSEIGLEYNRDWNREALDWVYRISLGDQGGVSLTAQKVSWEREDNRPQMERLLPPIDLEEEVRRKKEEFEAYQRQQKALMDSISPCPYCHGKMSREWPMDGGIYLRCWNPVCKRRPSGPKRDTLEDAVSAWNEQVCMLAI